MGRSMFHNKTALSVIHNGSMFDGSMFGNKTSLSIIYLFIICNIPTFYNKTVLCIRLVRRWSW